MEPLWVQFSALLPVRVDTHPLGCHRPRIPDRIVFDKLIQVLVLGAAYEKVADSTCSAATIRRRRDEWIAAGVFTTLEQAALDAYDKIVGLGLEDLCVDGCIVKAPCGGQAASLTGGPGQAGHQALSHGRGPRHPRRGAGSPGQPS